MITIGIVKKIIMILSFVFYVWGLRNEEES